MTSASDRDDAHDDLDGDHGFRAVGQHTTARTRILQVTAWIASVVLATVVSVSIIDRDRSDSDGPPPTPPPLDQDRSTVSLTTRSVESLLTLDGTVRLGSDGRHEIVTPLAPEDLYELDGDPIEIRVAIHGGPAGFDCELRTIDVDLDEGGGLVTCTIPDEVTVFSGSEATVGLVTARAEVEALPHSAVTGRAEQGQVVVVTEGGDHSVRDVELGIAGSRHIEILDGLDPGEQVLERPTGEDRTEAHRTPDGS